MGKRIIVTTIFVLGSIFSIWFLWEKVFLLTFVLLVLAVMELVVIGSKRLRLVYPIVIFGGVPTEIVAIYFGAWQYTKPSFLNVPLWLLPAWGNAGMISICIYELMREAFLKNNKIN